MYQSQGADPTGAPTGAEASPIATLPDRSLPAAATLVISAVAARLPKGGLTWPGFTITNTGTEPLHDVTIEWLPAGRDTEGRHRPAWVVFSGGPPRIARLAPNESVSVAVSPPWVNPFGWSVRTRWTGVEGRRNVADLPIQI